MYFNGSLLISFAGNIPECKTKAIQKQQLFTYLLQLHVSAKKGQKKNQKPLRIM